MRRNATLDLMRGLAAVTVALDHYSRYVGADFIHRGYLAVDFFYVLSGSVIAVAYGRRVGRSLGIADFLRRRVIRLYPLFAFGMALGVLGFCGSLLLHGAGDRPVAAIVASVFPNSLVLPAFTSMPLVFPLNGPMWSLFFEFVMNLLFAVWLVRIELEELILLVILAAAAMLWAVYHFGTLNIGWSPATLAGGGIRSLFGFGTGVLLARLASTMAPRVHGGAILLCVLLVGGLVVGTGEAWTLIADLLAALFVVPGLVAAAMIFDLPERLHAAAASASELAFPLYCSHFPLMTAVGLLAKTVGLPTWASIMVFAPISLAVAWALLNGFDRPARRWLAGRLEPRAVLAEK